MTLHSQPTALHLHRSGLRLSASLLVLSALLLFGRELTMSVLGGATGPAMRLILSAIFAWGLLRAYSWGWWASLLVGGVWLVMDFMIVAALFGLSGSLEPLYEWPVFPLVGAFVAQAVAMALLLRVRTGFPIAGTLGALLLGLVIVVLGFGVIVSRSVEIPVETDLAGPIYSAVYEKVRTPAIKVSIGTVNGVKGVRVVIADSMMVRADSATQAAPSRDIAMHVRAVLPANSALQFIGIGWSLDTGPGVMPSQMHRFSVDELGRAASATP
jgi:hypothetical protein